MLTILEGTLAELSGFLLELLDGTLIDTTALVDKMSGRGRLAGIDVTDDWEKIRIDADRRNEDHAYRRR